MKHIRIVLGGGLGNQLFQYAVYVFLKKYYPKIDVKLDLFQFRFEKFHNGIEIQKIFGVDCRNRIARTEQHRNNRKPGMVHLTKMAHTLYYKSRLFKTCYDADINSPQKIQSVIDRSDKLLFAGFYQNPLFASLVEKELQDSRIRDVEWGTQNSALLKNIEGKVSVSLHIRRGDYLNIPNYDVFDGLKYYERAMAFVRKKYPQVAWVVFSNDAKWVRENLKMDGEAYYVDWNSGADSYKDMLLMSMCSHHIIANSSFSWWGAWLNPNPDKMVLAPKLWFKNLEAENVVPSSWYLIDN